MYTTVYLQIHIIIKLIFAMGYSYDLQLTQRGSFSCKYVSQVKCRKLVLYLHLV